MADSKNINVAVTANISWDIPEAVAVIAADTALTGAITGNYTGDEGIEVSSDMSTTDIRAHQDMALVRTIVTDAKATYHFVFLENTPAIRSLWFGSTEVSGKIQWKPGKTKRTSWAIDAIDTGINGQTTTTRHYLPDAEVTEVDSLTYSNSDATRYGITLTAYNVNGRCADIFTLVETEED